MRPKRDDPTEWDILGDDDTVWLTLDHAHPSLDIPGGRLSVLHANLRLAAAFAERIERPDLVGTSVGGIDIVAVMGKTNALQKSDGSLPAACQAPWPNADNPAKIQLILGSSSAGLSDTIAFERCLVADEGGHIGPCTSTLPFGHAVFAPDASLLNTGSSAIPWYGMFTGAFPPYQNDQHPFLIWNLYRIDADGTLRQLGRSGVKHAFYAINGKCSCPAGHVVYPRCEDVYSSYSNDSLEFIGPRAEVLPARGIWGRCGSVFDRNCEGHPGPRRAGEDNGLIWRLAVAEGELLPTLHPGAEYLFEYGYLIRDSARSDASIGYRVIHPARLVGVNQQVSWRLDPGQLFQGTVVDHWIGSRVASSRTEHKTFSTLDGSGSVNVRVVALGAHRYRYLYAIMNFDLVHARLVGDPSNPRVVEPRGIDRIEIPHAAQANLSRVQSFDPEATPSSQWRSEITRDAAVWQTERSSELTWGSVYSIRIESNGAPVASNMRLHVGGTEPSRAVEVETLIPGPLDLK